MFAGIKGIIAQLIRFVARPAVRIERVERAFHRIEMDIIEQLDRLRVRLDRDPRIAIIKQAARSPRFPIEILM